MPVNIWQDGDDVLRIKWSDGHDSVYSTGFLRKVCPCAECDGFRTQKPGLRIITGPVVTSVKAVSAKQVGRYGVAFVWSDGHSHGIYSYTSLRQFCQCERCVEGKEEG
ncbi:MAG: DUF971 domain-containing protein [Thaumarchaeota archaeon]|nr:DUF971 domain-containing protein [Nitrososphaerota archaeon]